MTTLRVYLAQFAPLAIRAFALALFFSGIYGYLVLSASALGILAGVITGTLITSLALVFEFLFFARSLDRRLGFLPILILKSSFYVSAILIAFLVSPAIIQIPGHHLASLPERFWPALLASIVISIVVNVYVSITQLLGQGVLVNFVTGRYHSPILEERIFLFLDLEGSTAAAERIGPQAFHRLVSDFFWDISEAIVSHKGEIYEYVGDELIATWPLERGLADARCVTAVLSARDKLESLAEQYQEEFGVTPQFHAGMHSGVSVIGEMGRFKRKITFLGDVVNTTARIEQECRATGHWFLASKALVDRMTLPQGIHAQSIGVISLRGKKEALELYSLDEAKSGDQHTTHNL